MGRIDFVKDRHQLFSAPTDQPVITKIPRQKYLMVDGQGNPNTSKDFQEAMQALFGVSFTIKFMPRKGVKIANYQDFKVAPPEGLWWTEGKEFDVTEKAGWSWTLMIMMPEFVTKEVFEQALKMLKERKPSPGLEKIRLEDYEEGESVQLMYVGPYADEELAIEKMRLFAESKGKKFTGKHHEIYFGDPRRTKPEKLKTLIRHPVS